MSRQAGSGVQSGYSQRKTASVTKVHTQGNANSHVKKTLKTISLKAALAGEIPLGQDKAKSEKEVLERIDPSWNDPVSQEKVLEEWFNYMRMIQQQNPRLASIMKNHKPELKENTILFLKLKNATQKTELNEDKPALFHYLKIKLHNANLSLEMEVTEASKHVKKAFTAAERAKAMAEKNPDLLLLTKKFDLDVEM